MKRTDAKPEANEPGQQRKAVLRLVLGLAQTLGVTTTLRFVSKTGESALTFWRAGVTAILTLTSLILFRGRRCQFETPPGN